MLLFAKGFVILLFMLSINRMLLFSESKTFSVLEYSS